jgi:hypothetical protein
MKDERAQQPYSGYSGIGGWLLLPVAAFSLVTIAAPAAIIIALVRNERLWTAENANVAIMGVLFGACLYQILRKRQTGRYASMLLCAALAVLPILELYARAIGNVPLNILLELAKLVPGTIGALYFAFSKRVRVTLVN